MTVADAVTQTASSAEQASPRCDVCGHLDSAHDRIANRFCRATMTGALARSCICGPAAT